MCLLISIIAFFLLPNHFEMRFNLSGTFHKATRLELFIMPIVFFLVELLLTNIEKMYEKNGDLFKFQFSKVLSNIFPYIGSFINGYFILEIFKKNKIINGADIFIKNIILIILLLFIVYDYFKNSNNHILKIGDILIGIVLLVGMIFINILNTNKFDLLFIAIIVGLIIIYLLIRIKSNKDIVR